jgi:hypothetical protein
MEDFEELGFQQDGATSTPPEKVRLPCVKHFPAGKCPGSAILLGQIAPQTTQSIISFCGVILGVEYSLTDPKTLLE